MAILGTACMADKVHKHGEHIQQMMLRTFYTAILSSMHLVTC